jgi:hypothetical protein
LNYQVKEDEVGGTCSSNGVEEDSVIILVRKPEGKRSLGRPKHTWVDNIKLDLWETGWSGVDWIGLSQDRDKWRTL